MGERSQASKMELCAQMVHSLKLVTVQIATLEVLRFTFDIWLASILNVPLKADLSDIMKILVIVSFILIQGFWLYLKILTVSRTSIGTDQNFSIGCQYFLKKRKLLVRTKSLLFAAGIFLVVIFLFLCGIVVICLCPTYRVMMV